MSTFVCCSCNEEVDKNPKLNGREQKYCSKTRCQKARKAKWRRDKIKACPDFKSEQALSQKKWATAHPGYWRTYRQKRACKVQQNRDLQSLGYQGLRKAGDGGDCKDRRVNSQENQLVGCFWLVPESSEIAKIDALKVNISMIH